MKRKRRTEILINGSRQLAKNMASDIEKYYSLEVIQEPQHGMVMLKTRETAQKSLFYLGEVIVTECKVMLKDSIGIGVVIGDQPEFAYQLAVIDAAFLEEVPETARWIGLLQKEESKINEDRKSYYNDILKTKVSFENMDV